MFEITKKFILIFITCSNKEEIVILDERYYMEEIKRYSQECHYDVNCMNKMIKKNIPKKYYVHIRRIKNGWEFACIDTTIEGYEDELDKALRAKKGIKNHESFTNR